MKRVVFFGILCLLISCLSVNHFVCYAQVNAAIWIDSTNKNADTLDYDILFYKDSPKILNFYIEDSSESLTQIILHFLLQLVKIRNPKYSPLNSSLKIIQLVIIN